MTNDLMIQIQVNLALKNLVMKIMESLMIKTMAKIAVMFRQTWRVKQTTLNK